jgi:hypothetical protein
VSPGRSRTWRAGRLEAAPACAGAAKRSRSDGGPGMVGANAGSRPQTVSSPTRDGYGRHPLETREGRNQNHLFRSPRHREPQAQVRRQVPSAVRQRVFGTPMFMARRGSAPLRLTGSSSGGAILDRSQRSLSLPAAARDRLTHLGAGGRHAVGRPPLRPLPTLQSAAGPLESALELPETADRTSDAPVAQLLATASTCPSAQFFWLPSL